MQMMAPPEEISKERAARIDERFDRVDEKFEQVDEKFEQVDKGFEQVNQRITEGKEEMRRSFDAQATEMRALRQDLSSLHVAVHRGNYTLLAAMLGLIATILAKGG